ncbi:MAG: acyl-[acyl-carrier-protein]--UDP-N-acetylglucosamine O-acyltransferase [Dethiosulfovibrio peptidovorans]|nr:MAG: acyl-[acyl-carrier-protein]--UDP-N-acetylglucosamine O-acyltransferase [Dethiosulfovibrio peptidovorans]
MSLVHPTALVSAQASLADDVIVGPYSVIDGAVSIGPGTVLGAFVRIMDYVSVGARCRIYEHTVLGGEPQDHDFKGEESWVRVGDDVVLREAVTVHRASGVGKETVVGDGTLLMEAVHVGHNVVIGSHVTVANKSAFAGYSSMGDGAVMSGLSGLHQFVSVGRYCMIGGATKVVKDIPPYVTADGHPARIYGLNVVGLRRAGFSAAQRKEIKEVYGLLYRSGHPMKEAAEILKQEMGESTYASEILDFLGSSRRGLASWCR